MSGMRTLEAQYQIENMEAVMQAANAVIKPKTNVASYKTGTLTGKNKFDIERALGFPPNVTMTRTRCGIAGHSLSTAESVPSGIGKARRIRMCGRCMTRAWCWQPLCKGNEMDENEWAMIAAIVLGAVLGAVLAVLLMLYRSF